MEITSRKYLVTFWEYGDETSTPQYRVVTGGSEQQAIDHIRQTYNAGIERSDVISDSELEVLKKFHIV